MKKATVLFSICEKFKSRAVKAAGKGIFYKFNFFRTKFKEHNDF